MRSVPEPEICFRMYSQGYPLQKIAGVLNIHRRTVARWIKHGSPAFSTRRPARRLLSPENESELVAFFAAKNTATLKEAVEWLADEHGLTASVSTVARCCKNRSITWKKGSIAYSEMSEARAQQFLQDMADSVGPQVIALDEAAFFWNHVRAYAWNKKGTRAIVKRPGIRGKAHSLLLCIGTSGVVKWQLYEGAVNALRFSEFLGDLPNGGKLVLDNAVIHRATEVLRKQGLPTVPDVAETRDITLSYLLPYAPILNPVESCFNTIGHTSTESNPALVRNSLLI